MSDTDKCVKKDQVPIYPVNILNRPGFNCISKDMWVLFYILSES